MDSSRPWWRKSRMLTRKQTDSPMLRLEHYSSYVTHPSWQTSHPQQRFYMVVLLKEQSFQDHQKESIYIRSDSDSLNFKKNRKKTMTKPTEPKIYAFSKSRNKSSSFTTNKAQAPLSGHLAQWLKYWNVDDPTWSRAPTAVYRRNRAHLKPICHDGTSFQDHQPSKAKSVSFQKETSYMDTRSMLFDEPDTHQTPPSSPPRHYSPRSPSCSPPASFPSRESSVEPSSEDSSPKGRKRHQSEPAFIWSHDINQGLSHGLSALLAETSPLAPYRIQQQAKVKAQEKISTHKWLLSRPFETDTVNLASKLTHFKTIVYTNRISCFQHHHIRITVVKPPWTIFDFFQDHPEEKSVDLRQNKRRQMTEDTMTDSPIIIICTIECLHRLFVAF